MGQEMRVSADGLHDLAAQCDAASASLTGGGAPTAAGSAFQATSAVASHGHALVAATASQLAARATDTGAKLRAAASTYTSTDEISASQLAALGESIQA